MSGSHGPRTGTPHSPLQKRLYLAAWIALAGGLIAGIAIYLGAPAPDSAVSQYSIADPRYQIELQRIGGNAAVLMAQLHQWFDGLWHGKTLGLTVAALGAISAALCFFIGHFFAWSDPEQPTPDDRHAP
jgi:hypothetical protein